MSKKKFTEGLESLFRDESRKEESTLDGVVEQSRAKPATPSTTEKKRTSGSKDFSDDLQSFLQSAFEESFERQSQSSPSQDDEYASDIKKRKGKPMSGLDALIRATVEPSKMTVDAKNVRRLTVAFEAEKLQKLKKIARMERSYLRDIIDAIVEEYIRTYEQEKGQL